MLAERFLDVNKSWLKASDVLPKYLKHLKGNTYEHMRLYFLGPSCSLFDNFFRTIIYMVWPYSSWHPPNPTNTCWGAVKHYKKSAMAAPTAEAWKNIGPLACCYDLITIMLLRGWQENLLMWVKTIIYCINFINHPQFHHFYRLYAKTIPSHGWFMTLFHPHWIFFKDQLQWSAGNQLVRPLPLSQGEVWDHSAKGEEVTGGAGRACAGSNEWLLNP